VQPLAADRLFHLRIAEATGNGALVAVLKMLWEERMGPLFAQLEHHYDTPELWLAAIAEHRNVLKAIIARNPDEARTAMQKHLNKAYKRFNTGWDARQ
jgi:DNA-binding FadR family transcriptional regulator